MSRRSARSSGTTPTRSKTVRGVGYRMVDSDDADDPCRDGSAGSHLIALSRTPRACHQIVGVKGNDGGRCVEPDNACAGTMNPSRLVQGGTWADEHHLDITPLNAAQDCGQAPDGTPIGENPASMSGTVSDQQPVKDRGQSHIMMWLLGGAFWLPPSSVHSGRGGGWRRSCSLQRRSW
jgi:hypothetical protein